MILKYKRACEEAGLSEEEIRRIDQVFDTDKKQLKRKKKAQEEECEENGFMMLSLSALHGQDEDADFEAADPDMDVEAMVLEKMNLELLQGFLMELEDEDREFILECFSDERGYEARVCERFGITRDQMKYRKKKLIEALRVRFGVGK